MNEEDKRFLEVLIINLNTARLNEQGIILISGPLRDLIVERLKEIVNKYKSPL